MAPMAAPSAAGGGKTMAKNGHMRAQPRDSNRSLSEKIIDGALMFIGREEGNYTIGCTKLFHTRTRFLLMILTLFCLTSIWSNILCFNFAIICLQGSEVEQTVNQTLPLNMTANTTDTITESELHEGRDDELHGHQMFTARQRLYLTSAVATAALTSYFIVVSIINQFGIRVIFTVLGILSGVTTCFLPLAINLGFYYILAARVLQGIAFAVNFPVIGAFTSKWTYYKQSGLFVSALVAYVQLSPALTMPVSGALCTSAWGWPSVFYVHGVFSIPLFIIFAAFYRNSPGKHPFVGEEEHKKIAVGKSTLGKEALKTIPYGEILKTASVWAIWIAALGNFTCVNMMFLYSPQYLNSVLKFPVRHTGFSASLAPLAQFTIKLVAGFSSDKVHFLSETNKLKVYNSIAFFGAGIFLTVLALVPAEYPTICLGLLGIGAGLLGFTTGGFFKAGPMVSKHYSHFVTGNVSLGITITILLVPVMVTSIAPENTEMQWRWVFICTSVVLAITNILFVIMSSAMPAPWTTDEFSRGGSASTHQVHPVTDTTTTPSVALKSQKEIALP